MTVFPSMAVKELEYIEDVKDLSLACLAWTLWVVSVPLERFKTVVSESLRVSIVLVCTVTGVVLVELLSAKLKANRATKKTKRDKYFTLKYKFQKYK